MKKLIRSLLAAVLAAGTLTACASGTSQTSTSSSAQTSAAEEIPETVTITDHADREVTVPTDPETIAVLDIYPLASVLSVYLNGAESIVAMEPVSMNAAKNGVLSELYPEILDATTDIMDGDDVNIESLLALNPDVVFYNAGNKEEAEKLQNAGLTAVGVSATKFNYDAIATYNEWVKLLDEIYPAHAAENGTGDQVTEMSNAIYEEIQSAVADVAEEDQQKVLFLYQYDENTMITSGQKFFGQWWCDAVGAKNAAEEVGADNMNAKITMEQVYEWNPDVIIITNFTQTQPEDLYKNAIGSDDWSTVKAVQDHRVYKMPLGTYRTYTPCADTPMTLEWMAQAVYPDLFEYDVEEDVRTYYAELYDVQLTDEQLEKMYTPNRDAGSWN